MSDVLFSVHKHNPKCLDSLQSSHFPSHGILAHTLVVIEWNVIFVEFSFCLLLTSQFQFTRIITQLAAVNFANTVRHKLTKKIK